MKWSFFVRCTVSEKNSDPSIQAQTLKASNVNSPGSGGPRAGRRNPGLGVGRWETKNLRINPCKGSATVRRLVPGLFSMTEDCLEWINWKDHLLTRVFPEQEVKDHLSIWGFENERSAFYVNRGICHIVQRTWRNANGDRQKRSDIGEAQFLM